MEHSKDSLPSNKEVNPQELLKAITLRSGKELPSPQEKSFTEKIIKEKESEFSRSKNVNCEQGNLTKEKGIEYVNVSMY